METAIKCTNCQYGARTYKGTDEIRRISIELNWFELLPTNGTTEVLRPCPSCELQTLITA